MNKIMIYIRQNKKETLYALLIAITALIFRCFSLMHSGDLWIDEIYSYYFASKNSIANTVQSLYTEDLHTPLYFILLHLWIKLFGENDTVMRLMGFVPAFLTVPVSFYLCKKIFNTKCGYFASIMFAISPFLIYYTTELRFYGIVCFLSLLSAYFFTKILNDSSKKKNFTLLAIVNLLLLYTFNISCIFVFFQFITAVLYKSKKKEEQKSIVKLYSITAILYIPAFIMALHGVFAYKNSICNFVNDVFTYKTSFISILLQSYFSGNFFYANFNNFLFNEIILKSFFSPHIFLLIALPILLCIAGLIRALFEKNNKVTFFLIPALLFLAFEVAMAQIGAMSLLARYTFISYPAIICICAYGLSLFNKKKIINFLFIIFIISHLTFLTLKDNNPIKKEVELGTPIKKTMISRIKLNKDDYVLIPIMGKLHKRYVQNGKYIDFEVTDMLLNDVKKYYPIAFGGELASKLTRHNSTELLKPYILGYTENDSINNYFYNNYFKHMKAGQKFVIIVNNINTIKSTDKLFLKSNADKERLYKINSLYYMLSARIINDIIASSNKHLILVESFVLNDKKMSDNNTGIFVFVKK